MSARLRVLAALEAAGPAGLTTAQLCQPSVGGVRFGARVLELRQEGHHITEQRLRAGSSRYVLGAQRSAAGGALSGDRGHRPPAEPDEHGWRRVWTCPGCYGREVAGQVCPQGHLATDTWLLDARPGHFRRGKNQDAA